MIHSALPPQGIFVPARLIFHPELPAAVLVTWIQLRCLAREKNVTPPLSVAELASIIGIHPARLQRHLAQLQDISTLTVRDMHHGKIILSFTLPSAFAPEQPVKVHNFNEPPIASTGRRELPNPTSYFPRRILGYLSFDDDEEETITAGENSGDTISVGAERVRSLSKLDILRAQEHAYSSR